MDTSGIRLSLSHLFTTSRGRVKEFATDAITRDSAGGMGRDERDRAFGGERRREQVGARVTIHVTGDRQAEEIQNGWRYVDDRAALMPARLDRRAKGEEKSVR